MRTGELGRPLEILLVEDDPGEVDLTMETLRESKLKIRITVVGDGVEALAYLKENGKGSDHPKFPDLILLDLNLPKKDGREVLSEIKADEKLRTIPVVILTTSSSEEDVLKSYGHGASCYVTKPIGLNEFVKVVHAIEDFWFTVVKFPERK